MINTLLSLSQPLFVLDTETTSADAQTARIVEIAFQQWEASGLVKEWSTRINPCVPIPLEATEIHGITDADVADEMTFKQLASNLAKGLTNCSFAGQNIRYDLQVIENEMRRANQPWGYGDAKIIDSLRLEQLAVPRSLSNLYKKYTGLDHEGAHGAMADVKASVAVLYHQLLQFPKELPRDLDTLHEIQWPGRVDVEGKFVFKNGVPICMFGKYRGQSMRSIVPDYWRFILKSEFSSEIKALAENALKGIYPEGKAP